MARGGTAFNIDTSPTKLAVVDSLTRDATVEACVFDLVDNAVDAGRQTVADRQSGKQKSSTDDLASFEIKLSFNKNGFSIVDNCGGIPLDDLRQLVLRFGKRSSQNMGIGVFGVGLNRALFKLGKLSTLKTDTGKRRAELILDTVEYLKADSWEFPAVEFPSKGASGTSIEIANLSAEIGQSFSDKKWVDGLRREIGRRYGRFLGRGLSIFVDQVATRNEDVKIREDGPYSIQHKFLKAPESGILVQLRYGQHTKHRFSSEPGYKDGENDKLTAQFGWTIFCNDRAVILSDRSPKTGWDGKFHSEFYGFVGEVNFIGDPEKLPWNTTKTDVDLNNSAYQMALSNMRKCAEEWRSFANKRKKDAKKGKKLKSPPTRQHRTARTSKVRTGPSTAAPTQSAAGTAKTDHNNFRELLPDDVVENNCSDKHLALVHEAKKLDVVDSSYIGMALIRILFECSVVTYLTRISKYDALRQFAIDRRNAEKVKRGYKPLTKEEQDKLVPSLDEMLTFLDTDPSVWGSAKASHLRHSVKRMSSHQKILNSAIHNPWQVINWTEALTIRDEVLPVLRHMIET